MEVKPFKLPLSTQAQMLVKNLNGFDEIEFTKWWMKNKFMAGTNHIIEYLDTKK